MTQLKQLLIRNQKGEQHKMINSVHGHVPGRKTLHLDMPKWDCSIADQSRSVIHRDKSLLPAMPAAPQPGSPKHTAHVLQKTHLRSQQVVPGLFPWSLPAAPARGSTPKLGGLTLLYSLTLCTHQQCRQVGGGLQQLGDCDCACAQHEKVSSTNAWLLTTAAGLPARHTSTPKA